MNQLQALGEEQEQAVRVELNHVLESAAFRTSKRCRDFLAYIVKHTITGAQLTLKERSIGVELFQLPHDFDTGQHTIVRVTATEVRKKLAQHYLAENGKFHAVRIDLPPGSYSAEFKWATEPAEAQAPPVQKSPAPETDLPPLDRPAQERASPETRYRAKRVLAASLAAVAVIAGILFLWQGHAASNK